MKYIVQRLQGGMVAWLVVPDADSSKAYFDRSRAMATEFHFWLVARGYCLDECTTVVPVDE